MFIDQGQRADFRYKLCPLFFSDTVSVFPASCSDSKHSPHKDMVKMVFWVRSQEGVNSELVLKIFRVGSGSVLGNFFGKFGYDL